MNENARLTGREWQALKALLVEPNVTKAATAADLAESTIRRFLRRPAFKTALNEARSELHRAVIGKLQIAAETAVDALLGVLKKPTAKPADVVNASRSLLEFASKGSDLLDLERRIEALSLRSG